MPPCFENQGTSFHEDPARKLTDQDQEIVRLLSDADRALGRLDGVCSVLPSPDFFVASPPSPLPILKSPVPKGQTNTARRQSDLSAGARRTKEEAQPWVSRPQMTFAESGHPIWRDETAGSGLLKQSSPFAPVQRRLQGPLAKSKLLGACRTLSWPENLVVSIHARTICLR